MAERVSVLVVDDESFILLDVASSLEDAGYEVFQASNAHQAIDILDTRPSIRLLFTDIDMPGTMDGLKLAAAVRDRCIAEQGVAALGDLLCQTNSTTRRRPVRRYRSSRALPPLP